jgi:hypothetical protein
MYESLSNTVHVGLEGSSLCDTVEHVLASHFPSEECRFFYQDVFAQKLCSGSRSPPSVLDAEGLAEIVKCSLSTGEVLNMVQVVPDDAHDKAGTDHTREGGPKDHEVVPTRRTLCIPLQNVKAKHEQTTAFSRAGSYPQGLSPINNPFILSPFHWGCWCHRETLLLLMIDAIQALAR